MQKATRYVICSSDIDSQNLHPSLIINFAVSWTCSPKGLSDASQPQLDAAPHFLSEGSGSGGIYFEDDTRRTVGPSKSSSPARGGGAGSGRDLESCSGAPHSLSGVVRPDSK